MPGQHSQSHRTISTTRYWRITGDEQVTESVTEMQHITMNKCHRRNNKQNNDVEQGRGNK
jgi:hypothetical protein